LRDHPRTVHLHEADLLPHLDRWRTGLAETPANLDALIAASQNASGTEYQVNGEFADYGVRIDRELVAFIESSGSPPALHPPPPSGRDRSSSRHG
jgi:hypothetical protein